MPKINRCIFLQAPLSQYPAIKMGVYLSTGWQKNVKKRWDVDANVTTFLHRGTWGIQLGGLWAYDFLHSSKSKLLVGLGPTVRYQYSPSEDAIRLTLLPTNPDPVIAIYHISKEDIFAIGGEFRLEFQKHITERTFLGLKASFSTDTNGDTFINYGVTAGIRL